MTRRKIEYWVIPPQADAEFAANMEQVLDLYHETLRSGSSRRVHGPAAWCMLVRETGVRRWRPRSSVPGASTTSTNGPARPRSSCSANRWRRWRQATTRARRRKVDWALEVAGLSEGRYARLREDHLGLLFDNVEQRSTKGAFYVVFAPRRARQPVQHASSWRHVPKPSWCWHEKALERPEPMTAMPWRTSASATSRDPAHGAPSRCRRESFRASMDTTAAFLCR